MPADTRPLLRFGEDDMGSVGSQDTCTEDEGDEEWGIEGGEGVVAVGV